MNVQYNSPEIRMAQVRAKFWDDAPYAQEEKLITQATYGFFILMIAVFVIAFSVLAWMIYKSVRDPAFVREDLPRSVLLPAAAQAQNNAVAPEILLRPDSGSRSGGEIIEATQLPPIEEQEAQASRTESPLPESAAGENEPPLLTVSLKEGNEGEVLTQNTTLPSGDALPGVVKKAVVPIDKAAETSPADTTIIAPVRAALARPEVAVPVSAPSVKPSEDSAATGESSIESGPEPMSARTSAALSNYQVQLSAYRDMQAAEKGWDVLLQRYPALLGEKKPIVVRVDLGEKGIFYRLRIVPFATKEDADAFCRTLKQTGGDCLVDTVMP